jgi:molecular chaperone GrpE
MSKNKEKHHPEDEPGKSVKEMEKAASPVSETAQEAQTAEEAKPAAKPSEADPGFAEAGKLQTALQEIDRLKDQLLCLRADFENYRKRALREKVEIYESANEALMLELLPVIDHLQLALDSAKEHKADQAFQEGLKLIADQLMIVLAKYGLDPFISDKKQFDPKFHEAISCLPSETEPAGTIIAQSRQGYKFKDRLLRPAQVVVSGGKSPPEQPTDNQAAKE